VTEQVLTILETDTGGPQPATEGVLEVVHATSAKAIGTGFPDRAFVCSRGTTNTLVLNSGILNSQSLRSRTTSCSRVPVFTLNNAILARPSIGLPSFEGIQALAKCSIVLNHVPGVFSKLFADNCIAVDTDSHYARRSPVTRENRNQPAFARRDTCRPARTNLAVASRPSRSYELRCYTVNGKALLRRL